MEKTKVCLIVALSLVITVSFAAMQRQTGPTKPVTLDWLHPDGFRVQGTLPRSANTGQPAPVNLSLTDRQDTPRLILRHRRYKFDTAWTEQDFIRNSNGSWQANLPPQPPAGKLEYAVLVSTPNYPEPQTIMPKTAVIRFKGSVPLAWLIPHILTMFSALFFANFTWLSQIFRPKQASEKLPWIVAGLFIVGGGFLGGIIQKYAFGEYWTGFPFGYDLTDNKTLMVFLVWILVASPFAASFRRPAIVAAGVVTIAAFSIPHSVAGSELDYSTNSLKK